MTHSRDHSDFYYRRLAALRQKAKLLGVEESDDVRWLLRLLEVVPDRNSAAHALSHLLDDYEKIAQTRPVVVRYRPESFEDYYGANRPDFILGKIAATDFPWGPMILTQSGLLLCFGATGFGKSSMTTNAVLAAHEADPDLNIVVMAPKGDMGELAAAGDSAIGVFKTDEIRVNFFAMFGEEIPRAEKAMNIGENLCFSGGLVKANVVFNRLANLAHEKFLAAGLVAEGYYPSLENILEMTTFLRNRVFDKAAMYLESLHLWLETIFQVTGDTFRTSRGIFHPAGSDVLAPGRATAFQLEAWPPPLQHFFAGTTLALAFSAQLKGPHRGRRACRLFCMDESQLILGRKADAMAQGEFSPMAARLLQIRESAMACILSCQMLRDLSPVAVSQAKAKLLIGPVSGEIEKRLAAEALNIPYDRMEVASNLTVGRAIAQGVDCGRAQPVIVDLDRPRIPKNSVDEETRKARMASRLAGFDRTPSISIYDVPGLVPASDNLWPGRRRGQANGVDPELPPELSCLLHDVARNPYDTMAQRQDRLRYKSFWDLQKDQRALQHFKAVDYRKIRIGKANYGVLVIVERGYVILKCKPSDIYKGRGRTFEHAFGIHHIHAFHEPLGCSILEIEYTFSDTGHACDVFTRLNGRGTAFEMTVSFENILSNAALNLSSAGVDDVVFVCLLERECERVRRLLSAEPALADRMSRIRVERLDRYLQGKES